MRGWLTPETVPDALTCYRVYIPDSDLSRRAFYGAIMLLGEVYNWQAFGAVTPEEIAEKWQAANLKTIMEMRRCMAIGMIFLWPDNDPPEGALVCDGASYSTDDYPYLFGLIGHRFGGSGASFSVPDLRSKFPLITDPSSDDVGDTGGEAEHTLTKSEMPEHRHGLQMNIQPIGGELPLPVHAYNPVPTLATQYEGGSDPHNNMPPYMKLVACIQAE